jgi:hypothetical protein
MTGQSDLVTVYRSMDISAEEDCETIADLLEAEGLSPVIYDDAAPGVPEGAYEIRVPPDQQARAEQIIADNPLPDEVEEVDASHYLDLSQPIFHSEGSTTAEFEATEIKKLLEANGIAAIMIGDSVLPNFPFEVRVAEENVGRALQLIQDYIRTGPEAAERAERESEQAHPDVAGSPVPD